MNAVSVTTGASRSAVMSATAVNPSVVGVEGSIEPVVDRPDGVYMRLHAPPWDTLPGHSSEQRPAVNGPRPDKGVKEEPEGPSEYYATRVMANVPLAQFG